MQTRTVAAVVLVAMLLACGPKKPFAQEKPSAVSSQPSAKTVLQCGSLLDVKSGQVRQNVLIFIDGNKIKEVREWLPREKGEGWGASLGTAVGTKLVDLSSMTCLPGLIDTHTHVLLQGDITAEDYDVQLLKQSNPYRAIVGAMTAGKALNYGFTTLRDLDQQWHRARPADAGGDEGAGCDRVISSAGVQLGASRLAARSAVLRRSGRLPQGGAGTDIARSGLDQGL
jgi:imidazolonepropionase-like amidohydrolase